MRFRVGHFGEREDANARANRSDGGIIGTVAAVVLGGIGLLALAHPGANRSPGEAGGGAAVRSLPPTPVPDGRADSTAMRPAPVDTDGVSYQPPSRPATDPVAALVETAKDALGSSREKKTVATPSPRAGVPVNPPKSAPTHAPRVQPSAALPRTKSLVPTPRGMGAMPSLAGWAIKAGKAYGERTRTPGITLGDLVDLPERDQPLRRDFWGKYPADDARVERGSPGSDGTNRTMVPASKLP